MSERQSDFWETWKNSAKVGDFILSNIYFQSTLFYESNILKNLRWVLWVIFFILADFYRVFLVIWRLLSHCVWYCLIKGSFSLVIGFHVRNGCSNFGIWTHYNVMNSLRLTTFYYFTLEIRTFSRFIPDVNFDKKSWVWLKPTRRNQRAELRVSLEIMKLHEKSRKII